MTLRYLIPRKWLKLLKLKKNYKEHDDSISTSDVSSPRVASMPSFDVEINDSFERVFVPDNITTENQNFSHMHSPVPMQLVQRSSQLKPDINASFSSMDSETVSIPYAAESDTDLESAGPIAPSATLSRHDIIDMIELFMRLINNSSLGI